MRPARADEELSAFDVLVVGAGFGGLGAALALAEQGARVCICETLRYPGGCASTFQRQGLRFDAGATLLSGLGPSQLFGRWLARYSPATVVDWMDPLVELRAPGVTLTVGRDRRGLVDQLCALPGAPTRGIRAFFAKQAAIAEVLWEVLDDPELLPPFSLASLARHSGRALRYAPLLPLLGRPLASMLAAYGIDRFEPLRLYADALCQITVQCSAAEAETTFALAAMDYYYRGTAHVRGGVGTLATALLHAAETAGADVRLSTRVSGLRHDGTEWLATTRRGEIRARAVVANLLPSALNAMVEGVPARMLARGAQIEDAWGAAMIYAAARPPANGRVDAHHLQLVGDPTRPLSEGNHVFVSASSATETERAPAGLRTLTMSTHVPLRRLRQDDAASYVDEVHASMRRTFESRAPEWSIERSMTASPRTFARFVGRPAGAVGGLPRRAGRESYDGFGPSEVLERVWLVGDSVFPGQSALAAAVGGVRTATAIRRRI